MRYLIVLMMLAGTLCASSCSERPAEIQTYSVNRGRDTVSRGKIYVDGKLYGEWSTHILPDNNWKGDIDITRAKDSD